MANLQNLQRMTSERAREVGRKGGIASQEAKRRRKSMQEQLKRLLELDVRQEKTNAILRKLGLDNSEINNQMVLNVALYQRAAKGDTRAYEIIRDMVDGKPEIRIATNDDKERKVILEVINNKELEKEFYKKRE